jgi:hypothetical protein
VEKDSNIIMKELSEFLTEGAKVKSFKNNNEKIVVVYDYENDKMHLIQGSSTEEIVKSIINIVGDVWADELNDEAFMLQPNLYTQAEKFDSGEIVETSVYSLPGKTGRDAYRIVSLWGTVMHPIKNWKKQK